MYFRYGLIPEASFKCSISKNVNNIALVWEFIGRGSANYILTWSNTSLIHKNFLNNISISIIVQSIIIVINFDNQIAI